MGPDTLTRVNHTFDRVPRTIVRLGTREVPAFRSLGILGFHLGLLATLAASLGAGVPVVDACALAATAAASFFAWALVRRAVTGRETLVLLEHVWVAGGAVALYLWAAGVPVTAGLDVLAVGLCVFLALGRVGCLTAGCCHGRPAGVGVVYPRSHQVPDRLAGVRLFPVPLIEVVALLGIGLVAFGLAGGRSGSATVWCLAAYATVRFGTEALRGDRRPTVVGLSVPRALAAAQLAAALAASEMWLVPGGFDGRRAVALVPLAAVAVGGLVLDRRRRDPLATAAHLDELWAAMQVLAAGAPDADRPPVSATTSQGVLVAVSRPTPDLHVSLSHPTRPVADLPYGLGIRPLLSTAAATHLVVPADRVAWPGQAIGRRPGASGAAQEGDAPSPAWSYARAERFPTSGPPTSPSQDGYFGQRSGV